MRIPNTECTVCKKQIYRRPNQIEQSLRFCSKQCCGIHQRKPKQCSVCNKQYLPYRKTSKTCSRTCSNKNRTGIKYKGTYRNSTELRLAQLKSKFQFTCCMVEGCAYNTTYDVHRHVSGKDGGLYEIGNMFAICPNHHAEITRKIISMTKISDCLLAIEQTI